MLLCCGPCDGIAHGVDAQFSSTLTGSLKGLLVRVFIREICACSIQKTPAAMEVLQPG